MQAMTMEALQELWTPPANTMIEVLGSIVLRATVA